MKIYNKIKMFNIIIQGGGVEGTVEVITLLEVGVERRPSKEAEAEQQD